MKASLYWFGGSEYVASGRFLWNASYFVFRSEWALELYNQHLPEVGAALRRIGEAVGTPAEAGVVREAYEGLPKVAFDRGIVGR